MGVCLLTVCGFAVEIFCQMIFFPVFTHLYFAVGVAIDIPIFGHLLPAATLAAKALSGKKLPAAQIKVRAIKARFILLSVRRWSVQSVNVGGFTSN